MYPEFRVEPRLRFVLVTQYEDNSPVNWKAKLNRPMMFEDKTAKI